MGVLRSYITLKEWANIHNMGYFKAHYWYRQGLIKGAYKQKGTIRIVVTEEQLDKMGYIKFTEGECHYLTPNKPYEVLLVDGNSVHIKNDRNYEIYVWLPGCPHIGGNAWKFCDKDGNLA